MIRVPSILVVLSLSASAQRLWVVDANNGPGTHFTDLPPALAAAQPGDVIRIRAGTYGGALVARGMSLVGDPGATIGGGFRTAFRVAGVPAGEAVLLRGLRFVASAPSSSISLDIANCAGRVLVEDAVTSLASFQTCAQVLCTNVVMAPGVFEATLRVAGSTVVLANCDVRGLPYSTHHSISPSTHAMLVSGSELHLARSIIEGGAGSNLAQVPAKAAIVASNATFVISGDRGSMVAAGDPDSVPTPVSAIETQGGSVTVDPLVQLRSANGAPPVGGSATIYSLRLASVRVAGAAPGGTAQSEVVSPAGDLVLLLKSPPIAAPLPSPFGLVWLDPLLLFVAGVGVQGASEHLSFPLPLPNDPSLSYSVWTVQALSGTLTGAFQLSNGGMFSIR